MYCPKKESDPNLRVTKTKLKASGLWLAKLAIHAIATAEAAWTPHAYK